MFKFLPTLVAAIAIGSGVIVYKLYQVPEKPDLDYERWWGIGSRPREEDTSIRPFSVDFNETMVNDLKNRLRNRRPFTKPLEGIQSEYGMNTVFLETVIDYWLNRYDFNKRAELLNRFPHFKTRIQGLDIHFIRVKPNAKGSKVVPLLMMHGWPSSSKEFDKVIPMLSAPRAGFDFVFEVIAVDLPGFGFSEGTNKPGLTPVQISIIIRNLMHRLGHKKFFIQAGDWGSECGKHMATLFPDEVLGFHTNMPISSMPRSFAKVLIGSLFPSLIDGEHSSRLYPLSNYIGYLLRESGYFHLQATKPDTIGVALSDSPAGLAAYVMEKMAVITNRDQLHTPHGGLENLPLDDVLDTVTILWANNCIVTATRIYYEAVTTEHRLVNSIPTPVPTAALKCRHEVVYQPDWVLRDKFPNLLRSTAPDFGGHFAAMEVPRVLVEDVFESVAAFMKFHGKNVNNYVLYV